MGRKKEWFDDDSFWRITYPFMFRERHFANAPVEVEKALALAEPPGKAALDLCCGPGRYSIYLAKRGFKVTGVDRTKFLLDKARAAARAGRVRVEWIQKDMRDFVRPDGFDLIFNVYTSFGYFDDKQQDLLVLRNMLTSLKHDGVCLIDVVGKERLAKIFMPTTSDVLPDGSMLIQRHEILDDWTRIRNEWIVIRKGKARRFKFQHTVYSGQELKERLELIGFADVKLYGNLDGDEYGPESKRLIAVGRKCS